jgi:S1-C subfamily serine protease
MVTTYPANPGYSGGTTPVIPANPGAGQPVSPGNHPLANPDQPAGNPPTNPRYAGESPSTNPVYAGEGPSANSAFAGGSQLTDSAYPGGNLSAYSGFVGQSPPADPGYPGGSPSAYPGFAGGNPPASPGYVSGGSLAKPGYPGGNPAANVGFVGGSPSVHPGYVGGSPAAYPGYPGGSSPVGPGYAGGNPVAGPGYPGSPLSPLAPSAVTGAAPVSKPKRAGRVLVAVALTLLVVAAGAQTWALVKTNGRLDAANRARARAAAAADTRIDALSTRASQLESQLKGQLDPIGVAAKIAPGVWELDAGDYLGTAWAVRRSAGGGTDLVTNYHVVEAKFKVGDKSVALVRDKQRIDATVVKAVPGSDLALVHVSQDLPVLTVDTTAVVPGEAVLAEGTPLGWESSVSTGIVSNVNRRITAPHGAITYFQFDAGINPGNSGGPVVNAAGAVVGIASAIFIDRENDVPAQGMALAIPVATACKVLSAC